MVFILAFVVDDKGIGLLKFECFFLILPKQGKAIFNGDGGVLCGQLQGKSGVG